MVEMEAIAFAEGLAGFGMVSAAMAAVFFAAAVDLDTAVRVSFTSVKLALVASVVFSVVACVVGILKSMFGSPPAQQPPKAQPSQSPSTPPPAPPGP